MTRTLTLGTALTAAFAVAPAAAYACGGLFCDNTQPVNQAAERIVFGHDGERMHMHVRITYQGPPAEFGWLLPTAQDVEVGQSSEELFAQLDQQFAPRFTLTTRLDESCIGAGADGGAAPAFGGEGGMGGAGGGGGGGGGGVQVLARENVGPFDIATLLPGTVDDLRVWLDDNGYQIPEETDATLQPYVERESAFVAVKLLPDRAAGDISPLRLSFTAQTPAIPIVPTSIAANPDMGIIVHVLGDARAVPTNYRHVIINEAALDWQNSGQNYPDVVSQAADEADGQAFATDYAGPAGSPPRVFGADTLERLRAADGTFDILAALGVFGRALDADLQRVLAAHTTLQGDITLAEYLGCPDCFGPDEAVIDAPAVADAIADEIDPPREALADLFEQNPYLTRLYSTLSPAEMVLDPEFGHNADLGEVPNRRQALQVVSCDDDGNLLFDSAVIETPSGLRYRLQDGANPNIIRRQDGQTMRGAGVPGAQIIERALTAGPNEVVDDRTDQIGIGPDDPEGGQGAPGGAGGCACDAGDSGPAGSLALVALLGLLGLRRRR